MYILDNHSDAFRLNFYYKQRTFHLNSIRRRTFSIDRPMRITLNDTQLAEDSRKQSLTTSTNAAQISCFEQRRKKFGLCFLKKLSQNCLRKYLVKNVLIKRVVSAQLFRRTFQNQIRWITINLNFPQIRI